MSNYFWSTENKNEDLLVQATLKRDADTVYRLIRDGTNVNCPSLSPLQICARMENSDLLDNLLNFQAVNVNLQDNFGFTAMHEAAAIGNLTIIIILYNKGKAQLDIKDNFGYTPFLIAALNYRLKAINFLLNNGCNVNCKDELGFTALHFAAKFSAKRLCSFLIEHGADKASMTCFGQKAFDMATNPELKEILYDDSVCRILAPNVGEDLKRAFYDTSFYDLLVIVEGRGIKTHSMILSLRCKKLHDLLSALQATQDQLVLKIEQDNITYRGMIYVLEYLYSDDVVTLVNAQQQNRDELLLQEIIITAKLLDLPRLVTIIQNINNRTNHLNNVQNSTLKTELKELLTDVRTYNKPTHALLKGDVSFVVGNKTFYAHKVVMSARWGMLHAMWGSGMKESHDSIVTLKDMKESLFTSILEFIYTDEIEINGDTALEILALANEYSFPRLIQTCEQFISENMDIDNVCEILVTAENHQASQLCHYCKYFILNNYETLKNTKAFYELPSNIKKEINNFRDPLKKRKYLRIGESTFDKVVYHVWYNRLYYISLLSSVMIGVGSYFYYRQI